jgi:hypothetical protein
LIRWPDLLFFLMLAEDPVMSEAFAIELDMKRLLAASGSIPVVFVSTFAIWKEPSRRSTKVS